MNTTTTIRTDPAVIRRALDLADRSSTAAAAREIGVHHRTVGRWAQKRTALGPQWPTDADIAAWRQDQATNGAERRRKAERTYRYRNAVYLNRGPLMIDPLGTRRRLQALFALGWTTRDMAARLGVSSARVGHLMNGVWRKLHPATVAAVTALYDELCMTVPADPAPSVRGQVRVHERTRREALRRGYHPPLTWDDIDDPNERPRRRRDIKHRTDVDEATVIRVLDGEQLPCTPAERREVTARWMRSGRSLASLELQMGWKPERYGKVGDLAVAS